MEDNQINYIWKHRKRGKLRQRDVASLLGHADHKQYIRWERGEILPNLQNALKLSSILHASVESLFDDLYRSLSAEIEDKLKSLPEEIKRSSSNNLQP
ncbi:MAG TPA: helix-turn-helix transcriptional regulator [Thermodesulfobacteriota bacterium]|nr:helix-turn-helix transcriptional regulator [Thermodesulfobacteriota bacterium]